MIIDFHTHCFHDKIAESALGVLQNNVQRHSAIGGKLADLLASMREGSIDYSVVLNIATNVKQTKRVNDFAIDLLQVPGIIPFGSVHPDDPDFEAELIRLQEHGIKGIKFHPHYQNTFINDPRLIQIIRRALQMNFIISFHAGVDAGLRAVNYSKPQDTLKMLEAVSDITTGTIVLAHMGGYENFDDVEQYIVGQNVYLDTSFVFESITDQQFVRIARTHGINRILFGSDSPWVFVESYVEHFNRLPFTEEEKTAVLSGNAKQLLGL